MRNVCWDLLRWLENLDIETRDEEAMVCPTVMCSRHGSYDMHVSSVSCSCKDIVEYVAHTMCHCLERGCFQVVFWPLRNWIRAFVTMRMCSAQTPSNSSPFALHFLMPLWPTIAFHRRVRTWDIQNRAGELVVEGVFRWCSLIQPPWCSHLQLVWSRLELLHQY